MRHVQAVRMLRPVLTWLARLAGLALVLLVVLIAIGEGLHGGGLPNPLTQPAPVAIELILMLVMTIGLLIAWRWEMTGALVTLMAWIGFNIVELISNGRPAGGAFPLFAIPAVLYLLDVWVRHTAPRQSL